VTPLDRDVDIHGTNAVTIEAWGEALGLAHLGLGGAPAEDAVEGLVSAALRGGRLAAGRRQEIIIVASLLDRPPNLGGLARTCEVFGAGGLVLGDASIVKHPQFVAVSVSAADWVPIAEVSPSALPAWLRLKQKEGYAIVALEQAASAIPLQRFRFPRKTVLLLGAERTGVPAALLAEADVAVEIPQTGVVRSLNAHVSASLALWEYTRQGLVGEGV
jgi:tRNA guanosine-2'-O-methyltransferase